MTEAGRLSPGNVDLDFHAARTPVIHRALLCAVVGAVEGSVAFLLVLGVAAAYHFAFLHADLGEFSLTLYLVTALQVGAIYGTLAATSCSRFIDRAVAPHADLQQGFFSWTAAIAVTLLIAFLLSRVGDLSRVTLTAAYLIGMPITLVVRSMLRVRLVRIIERGKLHFDTIAVVGRSNDVVSFLADGEPWRRGHRLTSTFLFDDFHDEAGHVRPGALSEFVARMLRLGTNKIVIVGSLSDLAEMENVVDELRRFSLNVLYAPTSDHRWLKFVDVVAIGPNNALRLLRPPLGDASVLLKRSVDVVLSGIAVVLLSPLLVFAALLIKLDSRGPVFYRQARRGFNGETFMIWKFRTMTVAEDGHNMRQAQKNDARFTRLGKMLRTSSIDELPQLFNVLRGNMSLVGPRPHAISHDEELRYQVGAYASRQRIKPGITGWAQVNGFRGETRTRAQIEGRIDHDIYYIENWSIFLDLAILFLTVFSPTTRRNAR